MKVTIITITYNSEKTLERTICSILEQDYNNIEYIIVDGKSVDGTIDIINKYSKHIAKWVSEPDRGISDAFNKGLGMASGELIGILNSDDTFYDSHSISNVVKLIEKETDVIYGNGVRIYQDGENRVFPSSKEINELYKGMCMVHPATFVRKDAYKKYGEFNLEYKTAMDHELLLRMLSGGARFQYIHQILAKYYMGGTSEKNLISRCLPEEFRIITTYGTNKLEALLWVVFLAIKYYFGKIRKICSLQ